MVPSSEHQPYQAVAHRIAPHSWLRRIWPLTGGLSAAMTALEIEDSGGRVRRVIVRRPGEVTLRRSPRAAENEFRLLELLWASGLGTPQPVFFDGSGAVFPSPYLVLEYVEGQPQFAPADRAGYSRRLAERLATIHRLDPARLDLTFLPRGAGEYAGQAGKPLASLNAALDEARVRAALQSAWPIPSPNPPVLLHGDYWPGNILWHAGEIAAVIDWEDAQLGDPLLDFSISRLDLLWILGLDAFHAFTRRYQDLMALDFTMLPYWDLQAALRFIRLAGPDLEGWAAFFAPYGRSDITEATIRAGYRFFVDQALERLPR